MTDRKPCLHFRVTLDDRIMVDVHESILKAMLDLEGGAHTEALVVGGRRLRFDVYAVEPLVDIDHLDLGGEG